MVKRVTSLRKLMYEIRPSRAFPGEVGVFAVRPIKAGELVADVDSPEKVVFIHERDVKKLDPATRNKIKNFCVIDEDGEYCVPYDLNNMGSSWYFNHSCDSNIGYDKKGSFIALRNIKKDEELFLDYGRMFTDPRFKMKCACGAKNCRGLISGNDWLKPEFRKNNLDKMWPDMRKSVRPKK